LFVTKSRKFSVEAVEKGQKSGGKGCAYDSKHINAASHPTLAKNMLSLMTSFTECPGLYKVAKGGANLML
jgi:hypothetical protein